MLIFTDKEVAVGETFEFSGMWKNDLEVESLVYLWSKRNRKNNLGDEIVYGTAEVVSCLDGVLYKAKRIK